MLIAEFNKKVAREMLEEVLQLKVRGLAKALGWRVHCWYNSRKSPPGFPDLVLIHAKRKRILFRELKRSGSQGVISPDQAACMADLTEAGGDVAVWRPEDFLDGSIERELMA